MSIRHVVAATLLTALAFTIAYVMLTGGVVSAPPLPENRPRLADRFLMITIGMPRLWAASPEVVTSILWDYRGLDTVYETVVFYLAVIGALALLREIDLHEVSPGRGMTYIVKSVSRITAVTIPVVAASIALHGHLTPGGGFQGGAAFVVAPLLVIAAFSVGFLIRRGWSKETLLTVRTTGLIAILVVALLPLAVSAAMGLRACVLCNQYKPWGCQVQYPGVLDLGGSKVILGGSLLWLNISEFLAVSAGLTLVFLILMTPSEVFDRGAEVKKR